MAAAHAEAVATTGVAAESINVWLGPLLVLIEFDMFSQGWRDAESKYRSALAPLKGAVQLSALAPSEGSFPFNNATFGSKSWKLPDAPAGERAVIEWHTYAELQMDFLIMLLFRL
jgi:hypothetical protein